jgi:hypothetical protein
VTVFEIQEQLAELRDAGADAATAPLRDAVEDQRLEVQAALDDALAQLNANFVAWDRRVMGEEEALFEALKSVLARIAYLRTLLRDIGRALEIAQAA